MAMQKLRARVKALESGMREPIAIVGAGCRLPGGVRHPEEFWDLLNNARHAIRPVPPSRWEIAKFYDPEPGSPGKTVSRAGGYLEDVQEFDAGFFGISRREAGAMDPQQRLLLETAWEAIESACIAARSLAGSRTGVFVGVAAGDYANLRISAQSQSEIDSYTASSTSASVAAGRLAYVFGLHGPCLSIDTACSSSLAAVYLAVQSLRLGECEAALAGGVNLALSPYSTVALSQMRMLSPSDCCRPFDAAADGFVRGEGCTMFVLKRLSSAQASRDPILTVIRGAAMNHDGRSAGLTAPNGPAQEAVMRRALADANLSAAEIDWVETHGTGTQLGDPIEAQALGHVYGEGRTAENPLWIGAVKSNIGHLEAAAGAAGLLKAALALRYRTVPPSLHIRQPNPLIGWDRIPIRVATENIRLSPFGRPARAGVSSFGFSGTNVHLILEEPPLQEPEPDVAQACVLPVSARNAGALRAQVSRWADYLDRHPAPLASVCRTASLGRNHFSSRAVFAGDSLAAVVQSMRLWLDGAPLPAPPGTERYLANEDVDWDALLPAAPRVPLPSYPFARHRHWFTEDGAIEFRIDPARMPLLADHRIAGAIAVPAAVMTSLVFQAAERWRGAPADCLRAIAIANPLRLSSGEVRVIQIRFRRDGENCAGWEFASVLTDRLELHAAGEAHWNVGTGTAPLFDRRDATAITAEEFYRSHLCMDSQPAEAGVLGPAFRWMRDVEISPGWLAANIHSASAACTCATPSLSPALLAIDAAFQLTAAGPREPALFLPFTIDEIRLMAPDAIPAQVLVRRANDASAPESWLLDRHGNPVVQLRGIALRRADMGGLSRNLLHRIVWHEAGHPPFRAIEGPIYLAGDSRSTSLFQDAWTGEAMPFAGQSVPHPTVIFLGPPTPDDPPGDAFSLIQFLRRLAETVAGCNLWIVNFGAHPSAVMQAAVARVAALEHPEFHPRIVTIERVADLLQELAHPGDPSIEVAYHEGRRRMPALVSAPAPDTFHPRPDAMYWIAGGFGALGRQTALWLASRGARHLALSGRHADPAFAAHLETLGSRVLSLEGDIADLSAAREQLHAIDRAGPPLAGVFHAAGVLEDALLVQSTEPQFRRVLAPKVEGARNLVSLLEGRPLDFLVFYSSLSVWTAPPGQAAYAAANAFLDAIAEAGSARGFRTLSVNLGPWRGTGLAARSVETAGLLARVGITPLDADQALSALGAALAATSANIALASFDRQRTPNHPRLAALLGQAAVSSAAADAGPPDPIHVRIAKILHLDPASLDLDRTLPEMGVDSLIALELKQKVEQGRPRKLPMQDYLSGITLRELMHRLDGSPSVHSFLVNLSTQPKPVPLFLFPGAVGSSIYFRPVSAGLGAGYRVLGVDALTQAGVGRNLPQLAALCREAIRAEHGDAPCCLAGHSFGGFLALEIAHQMQLEGAAPAFLGLIDTAVLTRRPNTVSESEDDRGLYVARVLHYLYFAATPPAAGHEDLDRVVATLRRQHLIPDGFEPMEMVRRAQAAFNAMGAYEIPRYERPVTLFRAAEPFPAEYFGSQSRAAEWEDPNLGWSAFLPGLKTVPMAGNHLTLVREPHAGKLGIAIRHAIEEALTHAG